MNEDVLVLLLGANAGAYALAASFGEYGVPAAVMDEDVPMPFAQSAFVFDVWRVPGISYRGMLLRALGDFYAKYTKHRLILIPTKEQYTTRLLEMRDEIERMYLLPQKMCLKNETTMPPKGLLLSYVGRTGAARSMYATVCAATENGIPLAVVTSPVPEGLDARVSRKTPSFALYAVDEEGSVTPYSEEGCLSPMIALASAADTSLAEWILADYVLCDRVESNADVPSAVFSLYSYRRIKPYLLTHKKADVDRLFGARLFLSLYPHRAERKSPIFRRRLRLLSLGKWQKKTKIKK